MAGFVDEQGEDDAIAQINIVPFVDIVLVLLIIFMLTANLIAKANIPIELPRAATGNESVDAAVNIVVTANGDLFLDSDAVTRDELHAKLTTRFARDPKVRAVIAADRAVRYESVVSTIDLLKQIGIDSFALNIERTTP
jgi:biopolymer transport protein ExbD